MTSDLVTAGVEYVLIAEVHTGMRDAGEMLLAGSSAALILPLLRTKGLS